MADFCRPIFYSVGYSVYIYRCVVILLALILLNLPQPWPDLSNTVVCLYFNSVPYRKVRNRECKQSSRRVGPCFEHMPWYKERLVYTSFADQDVQTKDNA